MRIVIGSRKSDLARQQSKLVAEKLKEKFPNIEIDYYFKPSMGDLDLDLDLTKTQSKGVFTSDLHEFLKKGDCDLVVHSWKDLPIELNPDSFIAGTLEREDSRDVLFLKKGWEKKESLTIFSSSPRREYNLKNFFNFLEIEKELKVEPVRGNIPTRFKKFIEADVDGFVVASAAVKRLYDFNDFNDSNPGLWGKLLEKTNWSVLPESLCPSAAAQGALAIEVLKKNKEVIDLVSEINDQKTFDEIVEEREIHKSHGGGCHLALGVTISDNDLGKTTFVSGFVNDKKISQKSYKSKRPYPQKIPSEKIWVSGEKFKAKRELISLNTQNFTNSERETFVFTRIESCPENVSFSQSKTLYCSGLRTWKKLFKRGHWVNGCFESLGLRFKPEMPWESDKRFWFTRSGVEAPEGYQTVACYNLHGEIDTNTYNNCDYFVWMSGELMLSELKKHDFLSQKTHFLGTGRSFDYVSKQDCISLEKIFPYADFEQVVNDISE